jgi:ATP-dependent protease ClpP protease subunit
MSPEEAKEYGLIDEVITRKGGLDEVEHAVPETGL